MDEDSTAATAALCVVNQQGHVCEYCELRMSNQPVGVICELWQKNYDTIQQQVKAENSSEEVLVRPVCSLCYGLLDPPYLADVFNVISAKFKKLDLEVSDFCLNISLPVSITLRELAYKIRQRPANPADESVSLKRLFVPENIRTLRECVRDIAVLRLEPLLGLRSVVKSEFAIVIPFAWSRDDADCEFLVDYFPAKFGPQAKFSGRRGGRGCGIIAGGARRYFKISCTAQDVFGSDEEEDEGSSDYDEEKEEQREAQKRKERGPNYQRLCNYPKKYSRADIAWVFSQFNQKPEEHADRLSKNEAFLKLLNEPLAKPCTFYVNLELRREPLYIGGRYNKFSRYLSQTEWMIDGERKGVGSVEELIAPLLEEATRAETYRFTAAGREDVDVRCLGNGRPFVVQLLNCHRKSFDGSLLVGLQAQINAATQDIAVRQLQIVSAAQFKELKDGEETKTKTYAALCFTKQPISEELLIDRLSGLVDLEIDQKTPIRVLHRRANATRKRLIHTMSPLFVDDYRFLLRLKTQAGTYVKEFCHGDFGRTVPSLATLLKIDFVDILELDVESVDLEFPMKLASGDK